MSTSKADRLKKLFEGDSLPQPPETNRSHIADTEMISKMQATQPPWKVPRFPQTPRSVPKPLPPPPRDIEHFTSSEEDEYVRAFMKLPSVKPAKASKPNKLSPSKGNSSKSNKGPATARRQPNMVTYKGSRDDSNQGQDDGISQVDRDGHALIGRFCPFIPVTRFCYKYMDDPNDRVSKHFFASGKIWNRTWDIYYIHPPPSLYAKPILLVPEIQVQTLLDEINFAFRTSIQLPRDPFLLAFYQDGTPFPTKIGISQSRETVSEMEAHIPAPVENYCKSPEDSSPELDRSFARFKEKLERAMAAQKKKGVAVKKAKAKDRLASHVNGCEALRRGQRYAGLRPLDRKGGLIAPDPSLPWDDQQDFERAQKLQYGHILEPLDIEKPAPHAFDRDVIFVSIDVEAFERAHNLITEVGISTLDTADIKFLPPGPSGANWMERIRSRHFRISNHDHLRNAMFCTGDPEKFLFGHSEFFSMDEIGRMIDSCFEPPFSADFTHDGKFRAEDKTATGSSSVNQRTDDLVLETQKSTRGEKSTSAFVERGIDVSEPSTAISDVSNKAPLSTSQTLLSPESSKDDQSNVNTSDNQRKTGKHSRTIILVGHDLSSDLVYLSNLPPSQPSQIFHSPPPPTYPQPLEPESRLRQSILESLDTATLYQVWKREANITSLAKVLAGIGRTGWYLHNAGNDARYTLEGLLGILVGARIQEGGEGGDGGEGGAKAGTGGEGLGWTGEEETEEEKLQRVIRERQQAVEKEERENMAMWRHAMGSSHEGGAFAHCEVSPDANPGRQHREETFATTDPQMGLSAPNGESSSPPAEYSWTHLPSASRDGGDPKPFDMPLAKSTKLDTSEPGNLDAKQSTSSKRMDEILKLQHQGEIGGPCDWGVEGRDGW